MDTLDVLYDHYKETFSLSKESQGRRNKSFVILCVCVRRRALGNSQHELSAAAEYAVAERLDALGYLKGMERRAAAECAESYLGDGRGNADAREGGAILERLCVNHADAVGNDDVDEARVVKCALI